MSSIARLSKSIYRSLLRWTKRKEVSNSIFELRGKDLGYSIESQIESFFNPHQKYETAEEIRDLIRTIYRNKNNSRLAIAIEKEEIAKESVDFAFESLRHLNTFTTKELARSYAKHQVSFDPMTLKHIKYQIGEVVTHRESNRRGVVIGWRIEPPKDKTLITPPKQVLHLLFDEHDQHIYVQNELAVDDVRAALENIFARPVIPEPWIMESLGFGCRVNTKPEVSSELLKVNPSLYNCVHTVFADEVELLYSTALTTTSHNGRMTYIDNHLLKQVFISFNQQLKRYIPYPQLAYYYPADFHSSLYSSFYERKYLEKLFHLYSTQEEKEAIIAIGQEGKKNLILLEEFVLQQKILTLIDEETGSIIQHLTNHYPGLMGKLLTSQTITKATKEVQGDHNNELLDGNDKQLNWEDIINEVIGNILRNIGELNKITKLGNDLQNELKLYHPNYSLSSSPSSSSSSSSWSRDNNIHNNKNTEYRYLNYLQLKVKINNAFNKFLDIFLDINRLLRTRFQSLQSTCFLNLPTIQPKNNCNSDAIAPLSEKTRHYITDRNNTKQLIRINQQPQNHNDHKQKYLFPFDYLSFPCDYPKTTILQSYQSQSKKKNEEREGVIIATSSEKTIDDKREEDLETLKHAIEEEEIRVYTMIDEVLLFIHHHYHTIFDTLCTHSFYSPVTVIPPKNAAEIRLMIEKSLSSIKDDEEQGRERERVANKSEVEVTKEGKKKKVLHYNDLIQYINFSNLSTNAQCTSSKVQTIFSSFHPNREIHVLLHIAFHEHLASREYSNAREIFKYIIEECDSSCIAANNELSKIHYGGREYNHAIDTSLKVLQYCPLHPQALITMSHSYKQLGQFDKAEAFYRLHLDYHPWSSEVASFFYEQERVQKSIKRSQKNKDNKNNTN